MFVWAICVDGRVEYPYPPSIDLVDCSLPFTLFIFLHTVKLIFTLLWHGSCLLLQLSCPARMLHCPRVRVRVLYARARSSLLERIYSIEFVDNLPYLILLESSDQLNQ